MKQALSQRAKQVVIGLTLVLFVVGYLLIVKVGFSDVKQLLSFLVTSYLLVWGGYALITIVPRDEIRSQFLLMTLSLGVVWSLVEMPAFLKLIDYRKTFSISGELLWQRPGYLPDAELIYRPEPHHEAKIQFSRGNIGEALCLPTHPSEPFEVKYDKNGFRNEEDLTSVEIAVIGDSYVESPMMPASQLATAKLSRLMRMPVANLGQSGYGPQQELVVLKRYAFPLHPKTIIWMFYEGNDLLNARDYADMVSLLRSNSDSLDSFWDRAFTKNVLSWLMRSFKECVPNPREKSQSARATVRDREGKEHSLYINKERSHSVNLTKQEIEDLQTTISVIEEAYRLVQHEGVRFMVVFAPHTLRVYHNTANFHRIDGGKFRWDLNDLPERFRQMVAEISPEIEYVDLTPSLQLAARESTLVFLPDDTHWTSEGHRVVAETLAKALTVGMNTYAKKSVSEQDGSMKKTVLSTDAIMVRNLHGTIQYWSQGAQTLYGWEPKEVLGASSHQLLKTVFPVPLKAIEEELRMNGQWEGSLIHERRDGSKVTVISSWHLQENPMALGQSITILEVNEEPLS